MLKNARLYQSPTPDKLGLFSYFKIDYYQS